VIDPGNWVIDKALIDRPGIDEIMLDLLYDIPNQAPTFKAMREFLRDRRPPTLVATGANDEIFPEEAGRQILTDHPGAEYHALPAGHFALEDKAAEIAALMRDFMARTLPRRWVRSNSPRLQRPCATDLADRVRAVASVPVRAIELLFYRTALGASFQDARDVAPGVPGHQDHPRSGRNIGASHPGRQGPRGRPRERTRPAGVPPGAVAFAAAPGQAGTKEPAGQATGR